MANASIDVKSNAEHVECAFRWDILNFSVDHHPGESTLSTKT